MELKFKFIFICDLKYQLLHNSDLIVKSGM